MRTHSRNFILSFAFLFSGSLISLGQSIDPEFNMDAPRIVPPPPNAAALTKFAGVDVSLNTGMVKHQIPLYNFSAGNLSVPISLSYSSNGVRVDEFPSLTGMSWILNAGGVITRTVNGAIDETSTRQEVNSSWGQYSQQMYNYILSYGNPFWGDAGDTEPDVYSFNFGSNSGKFVLNNSLQPVIFPHSNLKIQTNFNGTTYNFIITDAAGVKYYFGGTGATEESYSNNTAYANTLPHPIYIKTSYYLNKIEHPVNGIITFTYTNYYHEMDPASVTESNTHVVSSQGFGCTAPCPSPTEKYVRSYIWYKSKLLTEINAANWGKVVFTYTSYNLFNYSGTNNGALKLLSNFYVADSKGNTIRSVQLGYNYFQTYLHYNLHSDCPNVTKRPFLTFVSNGAENYSFEYYSPDQLPVISSFSQDHWGFYNGKNNGGNFISNQNNPLFYVSATADRNPDPAYAVYGLLKKITYPTGGVNEIFYEGNSASVGNVGGLRVQRITTADGVTPIPITRRIYYYGVISSPGATGNAVGTILDKTITNGTVCPVAQLATCTYEERSSSTVNNLGFYNGSTIAYEYVTESLGGDNYEQGGIEHRFRLSGNEYPTLVINGSVYDAPMTQGSTLHGVETKTIVFKKQGAQYITLNETTNNYSALPSNYYNEVNSWKINIRWEYSLSNPPNAGDFAGFDVIKTIYKSYWERLDNTVSVTNDQNGQNPLTTTKYYYYNNNSHLQVTKIETTDSKGTVLKSEFKYPADFTSYGSIYSDMISRNIVSPVLDKQVFSNAVLQEQSQLTYKYAGINNQLIVPDMVKHSVKNNALENYLQYQQYDNYGNTLQFTALDGVKNNFIWNYNNTFPVAEIKKDPEDIAAYTSFEADGKGNWTYYGLQFTDGSAPTGKKAYALVSGDITKTGLNSSASYIVSYWSKSGPQNINGSSAGMTVGRTVNGWTYYEKEITIPHGAITISGSGVIDELRLYNAKASMTTYTYTPFVGITSICDVNSRISYYEYDEHQRLIVVRDQELKIIKKICYNYADQPENCNVFYNEQVSLVFTRDNCQPGPGGQVTYTIPAGTYLSTISQGDANQKAWNDIYTNGQAYANAIGICGACSPANCSGEDKKCVNGICETGVKVYTDSYYIPEKGYWICIYHYVWSDNSVSQDYEEQSNERCK